MSRTVIELSKQVADARYFSFSRTGKRPPTPVNLVFGGLEQSREDYQINRRGFPVFLMEYVEDGAGELVLDGVPHALRPGTLYWYGPGISCRIVNNPERPLRKFFFAFTCRGGSVRKSYQLERLFFGAAQGGEQFADLVRMLFNEGCTANEHSWRICCYYLDIILLKCARSQLEERHGSERAWRVFERVRDHIEDNYLELRQMGDISAAVSLDPSYISRLFKRYHHLTPYNFLMKKKMEHALDILRQGHYSVRETAQLVGFEDPFHFSRVFKQFKGIRPSQVRN